MSLESEKLKCSVCSAYLFEDDDVVYCPVCGAPHHRDCYNSIGHCGLEDKHGTPEQYDFSKNAEKIKPTPASEEAAHTKKCRMCGAVYGEDEAACPSCGTPDTVQMGRMNISFDYLGGVPADLDLGDGVTADEAKRFVFTNTNRYIPKFAAFKLGKKSSFNLLALLFPCGWFLSRKMYKAGAFAGALEVALTMLLAPFANALNTLLPETVSGYSQLAEIVTANMDKIGKPAFITAVVGAVLLLAFRIICGIFADYFYRNHCISTIKAIKTDSEDEEEDYRKKGGVSIILFLVGILAVDYLPQILSFLLS